MKKIPILIIFLILAIAVFVACSNLDDKSVEKYPVDHININYFPDTFSIGDPLPNDTTLTIVYKDNEGPLDENKEHIRSQDVQINNTMISGFDTSNAGNFTAKISYLGLTQDLYYTVIDNITAVALDGDTWKIVYTKDEAFETGGSVLKAYQSGKIESSIFDIESLPPTFSTQNTGTYTVTLELFGFEVRYSYSVVEDSDEALENDDDDSEGEEQEAGGSEGS
ncbi:MAG: hypothetical protein LBF68_07155 [Christensenellaceae bacterium]|jgi:hypothetical protein|nr:hypothetical protein [Christensenellaceae bacterium]